MARLKVLTVVGARPQFIKASAVSPVLRERADEVLVHTGQHYDEHLSQVFFDELGIPRPDVNLNVGSAPHGAQTGAMLQALEPVLGAVRPDIVMVYGDTNSTLAGALAAAKIPIPVAHVEAGLRSFNRSMPEEINRVLTDHLSSRLYCPTEAAVQNLCREGIVGGVRLTGDVMEDAIRRVTPDPSLLQTFGLRAGAYRLATVHRQENTDAPDRLAGILDGLGRIQPPVVLPLHPRTRERVERFGLQALLTPLTVIPPQGYRASLTLIGQAAAVLTDSGGVQREAAVLGVPVYVLREESEWVELLADARAVLVGADPARIEGAVGAGEARPRAKLWVEDSPARRVVADLTA